MVTEPRRVERRAGPDEVVNVRVDRARGGFSLWSVLSGTLVAFGAFVVLSVVIGAILVAVGLAEGGIRPEEARQAGIGVGIGLIVAQFLAYLWGGYTAGRMARGAGVLHGLFVPVVALVLFVLLAALIAAVGATAAEMAADVQPVPLPLARLTDIATGVGVGLLIVMLIGGVLGGMLGARWHTKLEDREATYPAP
jgi:hypothetical protein